MKTLIAFAWEGNAADAPYPLSHRLDVLDTPKCFKILSARAEDQNGAITTPKLSEEDQLTGSRGNQRVYWGGVR
jgi:hypothetical protein